MLKRDMKQEPIKRIVAMGDSITWGYTVSKKEKCWVNVVVNTIEEFQGSKIELINQGIGSNVLTPKCPAYDVSCKPSAIERVETDLIKYEPDMVFLAYGLNDSRGGTSPEVFRKEYQELINMIQNKISPVIVLINTYYMHEQTYTNCLNWNHSNYEITEVFNLVIKQLAKKNNLIYADVYSSMVGVDWAIGTDHCHPNDLGHRIIANKVFESIARNCSFTALKVKDISEMPYFSERYGNGPDKIGNL